MVTYAEVKKILDNLPDNLDEVAFLSDAYNTLLAYDGGELSKQVKNAISRIKKYINGETQKIYSPQDLTPEKAVTLNDYLSVYKEDELNTVQKTLKTEITPFLNQFDQENDITVTPTSNINNIQNSWEDASANAIPVFSLDRDNKIKIAEDYKEFEALLRPLKFADLQELIDVLHVNSIQDLSKNGGVNLNNDPSEYTDKLKENLKKADMQIRLAYLAIEKAEAAGKNAGDVDIDKAQSEYGITQDDIKNFDYAKADPDKLASAAHIVSCANTAESVYTGLRFKQKTNAKGVWYKTKQVHEEVSRRHPKLYNIVKSGTEAAKVTGWNLLLGATLGPIGVSGYAAIRTGKAIKKSVDAYKLKKALAELEGKDFHPTWFKYITAKENRMEAIGLGATALTTFIGAGFSVAGGITAATAGVAAQGATNVVGRSLAVGSAGLAAGVALQREQVKAAEDLKEFLISTGIAEKDISRKDLYFAPKKYCAKLLKENNIRLSASKQAEYEQKLNHLVQARAAKRIRYATAIIGSSAGIAAHELASSGALADISTKIGIPLSKQNNPTTLNDTIQTSEELPTTSPDTLQQNDTVRLEDEITTNEDFTTSNTADENVPAQKLSVRLAQRGNLDNHSHSSETYTPAATNKVSYSDSETTEEMPSSKNYVQNTGELSNPSEFYSVTQPEENVFITKGGTRVDLVEDDGRVEAVYSNDSNDYSEAECAEIDKNVYCAITEKQHPSDIEGQFAREYEETNNLPPADLNKSTQVETSLTEEQIVEKLGVQGKDVRVEHVEQNGQNITRVTVYPKSSQNTVNNTQLSPNENNTDMSGQAPQPQGQPQADQSQERPLTPREQRQQARLERQQARQLAREQAEQAEQWAAYDKKQGPTHTVNMGPEYNNGYGYGYNYGYYPQPSYSIREIPATGEPYLEISNYQPQVDNTLYNYVNSTRVDANNGVQYAEAMGGAVKGHPSNFDANAREFCTQLEQRDLVFKDLMNRQAHGYRLTEREARWVGEYQHDIASYGLAYDNGRLVPILDNQHTMEKFYPNTLSSGHKVVDTVNYRAANNQDWDPQAYNTNNRAQINVITGRGNQGR